MTDPAVKRAQTAKAQAKQIEAGWRRLSLRLSPETAACLDRACEASGLTPTQVISQLLAWPGRKRRAAS
jgi:hypothetical protein